MYMYFIAIVLPPHLNEKVLVHKQYMHTKYGCSVALRSPAHITLIPPFWHNEELETMLVDDVKSISNTIAPFAVETSNFSCFKPRTIFIDVKPNKHLEEVKKATDRFFE